MGTHSSAVKMKRARETPKNNAKIVRSHTNKHEGHICLCNIPENSPDNPQLVPLLMWNPESDDFEDITDVSARFRVWGWDRVNALNPHGIQMGKCLDAIEEKLLNGFKKKLRKDELMLLEREFGLLKRAFMNTKKD